MAFPGGRELWRVTDSVLNNYKFRALSLDRNLGFHMEQFRREGQRTEVCDLFNFLGLYFIVIFFFFLKYDMKFLEDYFIARLAQDFSMLLCICVFDHAGIN